MTDKGTRGLSEDEIIDALRTLEWFQTATQQKLLSSGKMIELAYKELIKDLDEGRLELSRVLGWCVEILQAGILVGEDTTEAGVKARGPICWYNHQQDISFEHALLLEHTSLQILRIQFGSCQVYAQIIDKFLRASFKKILGQNTYSSIGIFKMCYYTIYLPLALAMILEGVSPKYRQLWKDVEGVTINILGFLQHSATEFKIIYDKKGSTTPVKVLPNGKSNNPINPLNLPGISSEWLEQQCYQCVLKSIKEVSHRGLQSILRELLDNIYYRNYY